MSRKDVWANTTEELRDALVCAPSDVTRNPQLPYFVHIEPPSLYAGRAPLVVALGDILAFPGAQLCIVGDSLDGQPADGTKERRPALEVVLVHTTGEAGASSVHQAPSEHAGTEDGSVATVDGTAPARLSFALTLEFLDVRFTFPTEPSSARRIASPLVVDAACAASLTLERCVVSQLPCMWLRIERGRMVCNDTVVLLSRGAPLPADAAAPQGKLQLASEVPPPTGAVVAVHPTSVVRCTNTVWNASAHRTTSGSRDAVFLSSLGCIFYAAGGAQLSLTSSKTLLDAGGCAAAVVLHGAATRCAMADGARIVVGRDGGVAVTAGATLLMHTVDVAAALQPPQDATEGAIQRLRRELLPAWYDRDATVATRADGDDGSSIQDVVDTSAVSVSGEGSCAELRQCTFFADVCLDRYDDGSSAGGTPTPPPMHAVHATQGGTVVCDECTSTNWGNSHCVSLVAGGRCTSTASVWRHAAAPSFYRRGGAGPRTATSAVVALASLCSFSSARDRIVGSRQCAAVVDARSHCSLHFTRTAVVECQWVGVRAMHRGCCVTMYDGTVEAAPRMRVPEDPQDAYLVGTLPTTVGVQLLSVDDVKCVDVSVCDFEIGCLVGALPTDAAEAQATSTSTARDQDGHAPSSCLFQRCRVWGSDVAHTVHCAFAFQHAARPMVVDGCATTAAVATVHVEGEPLVGSADTPQSPTYVSSFVRADSGAHVTVTGLYEPRDAVDLGHRVSPTQLRVTGALISAGGGSTRSTSSCVSPPICTTVSLRNLVAEGSAGVYAHAGSAVTAHSVCFLRSGCNAASAARDGNGSYLTSAGLLVEPGATAVCNDVRVCGFDCGFASSFATAASALDDAPVAGLPLSSVAENTASTCAPAAAASCVVELHRCVASDCQTSYLFGCGAIAMDECYAQSSGVDGAEDGVDVCASGEAAVVRFLSSTTNGPPADHGCHPKGCAPSVGEDHTDAPTAVPMRLMTEGCLLVM